MMGILNELKKDIKDKERILSNDDLPDIHHNFMQVYGWIPFEEFKDIPTHVLLTLYPKVMDSIKKREEERVYTIRLLAAFIGAKSFKNYE